MHNTYRIVFVLFFMLIATAPVMAQMEATEDVTDQAADDLQPLRVKVTALGLMNKTMADIRQKAQLRVERMTSYLNSIDKWDDYQNALDPPAQPEMTFDQALEAATQHVEQSGTIDPSTQNVPQDQLERDVYALTQLVQPIFDEVVQLRGETYAMSVYLHDNDELGAYKKWAENETQKEAEAHQALMAQRRQTTEQADQKEHEQAHEAAMQEQAQMQQEQQQQMQEQFQLKQQAMTDETQIATAPYQDEHPYWGNWDDPYNDVWHGGYGYPDNVNVNVNNEHDQQAEEAGRGEGERGEGERGGGIRR